MFEPKTSSEQMLYATVRLEAHDSVGTGFFFHFTVKDSYVPVIITNQHVINYNNNELVNLSLHLRNGKLIDDEKINVSFRSKWYFHPDQDLCFCDVRELFESIRQTKQREVFYKAISENIIWDNSVLVELSAVEDVIMVGYPTGLWDQKNNFPLFRKGVTATHPAIDFNGQKVGAVDIACFPGSSGSPIFILNEGSYYNKRGTHFASNRLILIGILFEGPIFNEHGELKIEEIPTQQRIIPVTPLMINLGYYIKAMELFAFRSIIEEIY